MTGDVAIAHNTASRSGGGVYLSNSELYCQLKSTFKLLITLQDTTEDGSMPLAQLSEPRQRPIHILEQSYTLLATLQERVAAYHWKPMPNFTF